MSGGSSYSPSATVEPVEASSVRAEACLEVFEDLDLASVLEQEDDCF